MSFKYCIEYKILNLQLYMPRGDDIKLYVQMLRQWLQLYGSSMGSEPRQDSQDLEVSQTVLLTSILHSFCFLFAHIAFQASIKKDEISNI